MLQNLILLGFGLYVYVTASDLIKEFMNENTISMLANIEMAKKLFGWFK